MPSKRVRREYLEVAEITVRRWIKTGKIEFTS